MRCFAVLQMRSQTEENRMGGHNHRVLISSLINTVAESAFRQIEIFVWSRQIQRSATSETNFRYYNPVTTCK